MADDELSRSSAGADDDYEEVDDNGEDYEATLDEEEGLAQEDYANELRDLEDEGEMSIEELRKKYGVPDQYENIEPEPQSSEETEDFLAVEDETEGEDDNDYTPPDPWRKEPRVDEVVYQAVIPDFEGPCNDADPRATKPLWMPSTSISDNEINNFLQDVVPNRTDLDNRRDLKLNKLRDEEDALYALMECNYDINKAKTLSKTDGFTKINAPSRTINPNSPKWTETEQQMFVAALTDIGKNFSDIQRDRMSYRLVGELVDFYYSWKKTESYKSYRERLRQTEAEYAAFTSSIGDCVVQPETNSLLVSNTEHEKINSWEATKEKSDPETHG